MVTCWMDGVPNRHPPGVCRYLRSGEGHARAVAAPTLLSSRADDWLCTPDGHCGSVLRGLVRWTLFRGCAAYDYLPPCEYPRTAFNRMSAHQCDRACSASTRSRTTLGTRHTMTSTHHGTTSYPRFSRSARGTITSTTSSQWIIATLSGGINMTRLSGLSLCVNL